MTQTRPKTDLDPRKRSDAPASVVEDSTVGVANNSPEPGAISDSMKNAAVADVKFPRCNAAVGKMEGGEWDLADAILAECSEPGEDGVQNGSYAKMREMQQEIAANLGVKLSFERIRKLRTVASAFPAGRRRPAVSLEVHLEAGTAEALDAFIGSAPMGTPLTREYIRQMKHLARQAEKNDGKVERRRQVKAQLTALLNLCKQQEREKEEREQRYADLCRSVGKEPEPFSPPLSPEEQPPLTDAKGLEQALRFLLRACGFDPTADNMKRAIEEFVHAVLADQ